MKIIKPVFRSRGGFSPGLNLRMWVQAGVGLWQDTAGSVAATLVADPVARWDDQTGNGNNLLQATPSKRLSIGSTTLNGYNCVVPDTVDDFLQAAFTLVQPETLYIVAGAVAWINGDRLCDGLAASTGMLRQNSSSPNMDAYAGSFSSLNANLTIPSNRILTTIFNGASSSFQVDNTAAVTGNFGVLNMSGFTLAARGDGVGSWGGPIWEVLLYAEAHNASQQNNVKNYLATKYGLSI